MAATFIRCRTALLRDLTEEDRPDFIRYQLDPRYMDLYDLANDEAERPNQLFDRFLGWQREVPRLNFQLGVFEPITEQLLGCGGLRKVDDTLAVFGIELAPSEWGRFRLALDVAGGLLRHGFETMGLRTIVGTTASGNRRVEKLARWFGGEIVARRDGPSWMQVRGWDEVDWSLTREQWQASTN